MIDDTYRTETTAPTWTPCWGVAWTATIAANRGITNGVCTVSRPGMLSNTPPTLTTSNLRDMVEHVAMQVPCKPREVQFTSLVWVWCDVPPDDIYG